MECTQITTSASYPYLSEASSERSESARANHTGVDFFLMSADIRYNPSCIIQARGMTKSPAEAQNGYRSRSSFSPLPWEDSYPPGLYTAIVHNGPLRKGIQDHLEEFEEFSRHIFNTLKNFFLSGLLPCTLLFWLCHGMLWYVHFSRC